MQAARNVAASRKTAHELHWVSLLLQFIDNALERSSGVHGHARYRTGFRTDYPGAVLRPHIRLSSIVSVPTMMSIVPDMMPDMMDDVVPVNVMRAMLTMSGLGR